MYSGGSGLIHFVDIELSYDVLSPLPIVLSKHPHPYIEIATAISDIGVHVQKPRNEGWSSFLSFSAVSVFSQQTQKTMTRYANLFGFQDCETNKHALHNESVCFKIGTKYCNSITGDCYTKSHIILCTYIAHVKHYWLIVSQNFRPDRLLLRENKSKQKRQKECS